jgi:nitrogen fixation/metabolism regulation signal transduction histidine kinase
MISVLLLSFMLIGGGMVYYNIQQYQKKNYETIVQKIQAIQMELEHKVEYEKDINENMRDYLTYSLVKLSNIFYTDINLYDLHGNLFATSRPELFENGLIGQQIDADAFVALKYDKESRFIHDEQIGSLEYMSAYIPFKDSNNNTIALLNLPYFSKESEIKNEISNMVVTIINIYLFLAMLVIFIAVVLSNRITLPLRIISDKFKEIKLGRKNEPIEWKNHDEIGSLIQEYNRMVEELAKNVELIAKSEREGAWREMAKQIAHEIKNPLTPIKLSIQLLERSWNAKEKDFSERLIKVTNTITEQIDALSDIANEFSNFAKMPHGEKEIINLIQIINNTVNLFTNTPGITISTDYNNLDSVSVFADKEELLRVFNNLIKNAIQSIPVNSQGIINISLSRNNNRIIIKVSDNGTGIPDEMKDKLFQPNFTTKTSGMGLGLTIVKNIIENSDGNISFETEPGKGTSFFIELPLAE